MRSTAGVVRRIGLTYAMSDGDDGPVGKVGLYHLLYFGIGHNVHTMNQGLSKRNEPFNENRPTLRWPRPKQRLGILAEEHGPDT